MGVVGRWARILAERQAKEAAALKAYRTARADRKAAERVIARHKDVAAKKALQYAQSKAGVTESPAGSNRGKQIDEWERAVGMVGQPWCGAFMFACLSYAGVKGLSSRLRYCPYIIEDAKAGRNGLERVVPAAERKPGDLLVFQFDGGPVDHVGMYVATAKDGSYLTIEGNTSTGPGGSQSNGGIVANRTRDPRLVAAIVRPAYPS